MLSRIFAALMLLSSMSFAAEATAELPVSGYLLVPKGKIQWAEGAEDLYVAAVDASNKAVPVITKYWQVYPRLRLLDIVTNIFPGTMLGDDGEEYHFVDLRWSGVEQNSEYRQEWNKLHESTRTKLVISGAPLGSAPRLITIAGHRHRCLAGITVSVEKSN